MARMDPAFAAWRENDGWSQSGVRAAAVQSDPLPLPLVKGESGAQENGGRRKTAGADNPARRGLSKSRQRAVLLELALEDRQQGLVVDRLLEDAVDTDLLEVGGHVEAIAD